MYFVIRPKIPASKDIFTKALPIVVEIAKLVSPCDAEYVLITRSGNAVPNDIRTKPTMKLLILNFLAIAETWSMNTSADFINIAKHTRAISRCCI